MLILIGLFQSNRDYRLTFRRVIIEKWVCIAPVVAYLVPSVYYILVASVNVSVIDITYFIYFYDIYGFRTHSHTHWLLV